MLFRVASVRCAGRVCFANDELSPGSMPTIGTGLPPALTKGLSYVSDDELYKLRSDMVNAHKGNYSLCVAFDDDVSQYHDQTHLVHVVSNTGITTEHIAEARVKLGIPARGTDANPAASKPCPDGNTP